MNDFIPENESTDIYIVDTLKLDINETPFNSYGKEDLIRHLTKGYSPNLPENVKDNMLEKVLVVLNVDSVKSIKVIKKIWSDGAFSFEFSL